MSKVATTLLEESVFFPSTLMYEMQASYCVWDNILMKCKII
ncbi:hypothetical protein MtrunA17_Chr6g0470721 [Medicago truncatula]|uniref:Uncharacterized protein n=1 Tax=Medicago truncatula TaxID=3880 RepID=A0A396HL44_MEDTR|nr:hypothetical protein MtrunA17_Chr6g0470721 [Medicago truncatula]